MELWEITARIMKKDNYLIAMVHYNIIKYHLPLLTNNMSNRLHRVLRHILPERFIPKFRIKIFCKLLLWSITYCVVNFLVDDNNELKQEVMVSEHEHVKKDLINKIQKRLRIVGLVNFLLLPFLAVSVPVYTLFQYGEEFYKNPGNASARDWSLRGKWKFREYNELPHLFRTR